MQQPSLCTSTVFNKALLLQAEPAVQPADARSMQHTQAVWPGWLPAEVAVSRIPYLGPSHQDIIGPSWCPNDSQAVCNQALQCLQVQQTSMLPTPGGEGAACMAALQGPLVSPPANAQRRAPTPDTPGKRTDVVVHKADLRQHQRVVHGQEDGRLHQVVDQVQRRVAEEEGG